MEKLDHNSVYRFLKNTKHPPRDLFEEVRKEIIVSENGYLLFDDSVAIKKYSSKIDGVRRQYAGCEHRVEKGIGVVNCLYYNPELKRYWILDFRIFDPERDGLSKLDHAKEMLRLAVHREIPFKIVLMDTWYATTEFMTEVDSLGKVFYCPIKNNRLVAENLEDKKYKYKNAEKVEWEGESLEEGKPVKLNKMKIKVKLFRVMRSTTQSELIVTNDLTQNSAEGVHNEVVIRWKIEQFHRELKQITGFPDCECRLNRSQRNHICIAYQVWNRMNTVSYQKGITIYQLKERLLDDYMVKEMANPTIPFYP